MHNNHSTNFIDPLIEKTFRQVRFVASYPHLRIMPEAWFSEVAFIGRSNSGKSTLLNALCYQKNLARSGKTPGVTRSINVFSWLPTPTEPEKLIDCSENNILSEESQANANITLAPPSPPFIDSPFPRIQWIDLPGYGYAKMSHGEADAVARVLVDYLQNRKTLKAVVLMIDPRRGVQAIDEQVLSMLMPNIRLAIVHTKIDKLSRNELPKLQKQTEQYLQKQHGAFVETCVFYSSSLAKSREGKNGIKLLRQWLYNLAEPIINTELVTPDTHKTAKL